MYDIAFCRSSRHVAYEASMRFCLKRERNVSRVSEHLCFNLSQKESYTMSVLFNLLRCQGSFFAVIVNAI